MARVGIEPTAFEILSLDGLPVAYRAVAVPSVRFELTHTQV